MTSRNFTIEEMNQLRARFSRGNRGFRDLDLYNQYLEGYATPEGRIK